MKYSRDLAQLKAIGMASRVARLTEISSRWFEMVERK
jgi:hypothetical protein